jgi:hypothetical protein
LDDRLSAVVHPTRERRQKKDQAVLNLSDRIPDGDNEARKHSKDEPRNGEGERTMNHTNRVGSWVPIAALLSLCTPAPGASAGERTAVLARNKTFLDAPEDAELLAAYQSDRSNQKLQSWGQYRSWVQTFYKGNLISEGWSKFGEVNVNAVKSAPAREAVIASINELGRIISLEWAKDSSVRRITTGDLRRWNDLIAAARESDDGNGQHIIKALTSVRRMAERLR